MLEYTVEGLLVKRVAECGGVAIKISLIRGFPDRIVFMPGGRIIVVEVKRPKGGRASPHQMLWLKHLRSLGVEVAVVRNSDDIERLLAK